MNSSFHFDGRSLRITLSVEGNTEQAMAALLEKLTAATVHVEYTQYGYQRSDNIKSVTFTMREPSGEERAAV